MQRLQQFRSRVDPWLTRARPWLLSPYVLITGAYVALRFLASARVAPRTYRDTQGYLDVARESLFSGHFWAGERPWVIPLVYKFVPEAQIYRIIAHVGISIGCWLALAGVMAWVVRDRRLRIPAFVLILLFSLAFPILQWDTIITTESVSLSLTALLLAAWLALVHAPGRWTAAAVVAATVFWVFARDSHAYVAVLAVPLLLLWLWREREHRLALGAVAVASVAIFGLSLLSASTEDARLRRWERPLLHVMSFRILPNPEAREYFKDRGMPYGLSVRVNRHRLAGVGHSIPEDPQTRAFLEWLRKDGKSTYAGYLASHPKDTIKPVITKRDDILDRVTGGYESREARKAIPPTFESLIYPATSQTVFFWLIVLAVLAGLVAVRFGLRREWAVPIAALALQVPHAVLVYHGDTLEVPRHSLVVSTTVRLATIVLALLVLDAWLTRRREPRAQASG